MDKIRLGVIGCGYISDLTVCGYLDDKRAVIQKVCDVDEKCARAKADLWGAEASCQDWRELLDDPEIDAVEIITPHYLHKEMAVAAAQAGKHVSVQKPMAMNVAEVDEMVKAAEDAGVKLRVFEAYVFYPPIVKAREIIQSGEIGPPTSMHIVTNGAMPPGGWSPEVARSYEWRFQKEKIGGGTLFDDMHHKYATLRYLVGEVDEIYSMISNREQLLDVPSVCAWRFKDTQIPAYGTLNLTFSPELIVDAPYYSVDERFEVIGAKGILWVTRCTSEVFHIPPLIVQTSGRRVEYTELKTGWEVAFNACGKHFIDCIIEDKAPMYSPADARKVIQLSHAIYRSDEEKRAVSPEEITR